jgi:hypothetical protein
MHVLLKCNWLRFSCTYVAGLSFDEVLGNVCLLCDRAHNDGGNLNVSWAAVFFQSRTSPGQSLPQLLSSIILINIVSCKMYKNLHGSSSSSGGGGGSSNSSSTNYLLLSIKR